MKTPAIALAAAFAAAFAFAGNYDKYVNWRWTPDVIVDSNASDNVRHELDFTLPVHGPWLTIPSETGMTVTWITRIPCAGGVEYREKGTTNWVERWQTTYGVIDYSREVQAIHLSGLKPGTEYEYRLLSNVDKYTTAYHSVLSRGREIYSFKTVDNRRTNYRVFFTSDIHGSFRLTLDPMIARSGAEDCDYYFLLGDNVEDGVKNNIRFFTTFGFLDDITRKWGTSKPTIFCRGNHDYWGCNTYKYGEYFPQPDGKTYSAFRQGPCLFIALDTQWIPTEALQKRQWRAYLAEQDAWMRNLKQTDLWKKSAFRIAMFHVPLFPGEGTKFALEAFGETFSDESKEGRVHAVLTGHEHCYARINPNTKEGRVNNAYGDFPIGATGRRTYPPKVLCREKFPDRFPYVSVVLQSAEGMTLDVSPEKLVFKSHRWDKPEGGCYDAFEISPDGQVKDLVETTVVPWPQPEPKSEKGAKSAFSAG